MQAITETTCSINTTIATHHRTVHYFVTLVYLRSYHTRFFRCFHPGVYTYDFHSHS